MDSLLYRLVSKLPWVKVHAAVDIEDVSDPTPRYVWKKYSLSSGIYPTFTGNPGGRELIGSSSNVSIGSTIYYGRASSESSFTWTSNSKMSGELLIFSETVSSNASFGPANSTSKYFFVYLGTSPRTPNSLATVQDISAAYGVNSGNSQLVMRYDSSTRTVSVYIEPLTQTAEVRYITPSASGPSKKDFLETISTSSSGSYPSDGKSGSNWYVYQGSDTIDANSISYPSSMNAGTSYTISVTPSTNNTYGGTISYTYQYKTSQDMFASWTTIQTTTNTSISFTCPTSSYLRFRVQAKDNYGFTSSTYTVGSPVTVITNTAPTVPSSLSVPSSIVTGQQFTVTWGASTDSDNNLSGYQSEYSTNGGSTWIGSTNHGTTSRTRNFTLPVGTTSFMFRVRAYDSQSAYSGYKSSSSISVTQNSPPGAPSNLRFAPGPAYVGQLLPTLMWDAAVDPDGNLSGYYLYVLTQGEGTVISRKSIGVVTSYTPDYKPAKGTTKVYFQLQAFDTYGEESLFAVSPNIDILQNAPPEIGFIGTGSVITSTPEGTGFKLAGTDLDNDSLSAQIYLDGVLKKSYPSITGTATNISLSDLVTEDEWVKLAPGSHKVKAVISDGELTSEEELTFIRKISAIDMVLIEPMEADEMPTRMYCYVQGVLPENACTIQFFACNNALDDNPSWQDVTNAVKLKKKFFFENTTKTADSWAVSVKMIVTRTDGENLGNYAQGISPIHVTRIEGAFDGYNTNV